MSATHTELLTGRRPMPEVETRTSDDGTLPAAPDVACLQDLIVNVVFVGYPGDRWVLVDAGMPYTAAKIEHAAERRYGRGSRPEAIILTHGHFDHVGALHTLAEKWDVPVYAHRLELPYVTGLSSYPPPDPTVGGGLMARLSPLFPRGPYDAGRPVRALPDDGSVPGLPAWRWVATPGHSPGHVSFFRESDRTLIAGDAFVTTKQESALAALTQAPRVNRPPAYFTQDWDAARRSVQLLYEMDPAAVVTGHGLPMRGEQLHRGLQYLVDHFDQEMPQDGRYVREPAVFDERGPAYVPPPVPDPLPKVLATVAVAAGIAAAVAAAARRRD
jgi:glyoxylase-like metal-dependent hydrolase (beta-lactamase superfamily II)